VVNRGFDVGDARPRGYFEEVEVRGGVGLRSGKGMGGEGVEVGGGAPSQRSAKLGK